MADDSDLDALARRYFDLWQTQLAGMAADRTLAGTLARVLAAANAQVANAFGSAGSPVDGGVRSAAAGAAPAAAAPSDSAADLRELGERVAALERRIAELETRLAKPARSKRSSTPKAPVASKRSGRSSAKRPRAPKRKPAKRR
jgi:CO/xanthine dehydrogenase Mo-binding subunit